MLPDFSKPAFALVALGSVRFRHVEDGGRVALFHSDYRCQFRYSDDEADKLADVRVYLVGQEQAHASDDAPVAIAFLDPERHRDRCKVGVRFELREGAMLTATGTVQAVATQ
jgi:hypothetical protein